jgi:Mlc titration factor MtfA (ptsG expression regulator)
MGIFSALRKARRGRIVEKRPIPEDLWEWAISEHSILRGFSPEDLGDLRRLSTVFIAEKRFYPVGGLELEDDMLISIAAQACLPVLKLGIDWYSGWSSIIVSPEEFSITRKDLDRAGVIHEYEDELSGQVLDLGPVVLSWRDVEASGWGEGYNVVIHEMAHKLDERDGEIDGCPPLPPKSAAIWRKSLGEAFLDFRRKAENSGRKGAHRLPLDEYAAESPDEFFAVSCEYFFERPRTLKKAYPEVYERLREFFLQDPSERLTK